MIEGRCFLTAASAVCELFSTTLPSGKPIALAVAVAAGIHLLNALGFYILSSTNGHAGAIMIPFVPVSAVLPTSTYFVGMPVGNALLFILPAGTFLLYFASLVVGRGDATTPTDG